MTDATPTPESRCPWCSTLLETGAATCPSCGASLHGDDESQVPGLTSVDPIAVIEGARASQRQRNRLVSWITGDDPGEAVASSPATADALALPPVEVRREMLRLQLEAELTQRAAEVESYASDHVLALSESGQDDAARAAVEAITRGDLAIAPDAGSDEAEASPDADAPEPATKEAAEAAEASSEPTADEPAEPAEPAEPMPEPTDPTPEPSADASTAGA